MKHGFAHLGTSTFVTCGCSWVEHMEFQEHKAVVRKLQGSLAEEMSGVPKTCLFLP